MTVSKLLSELEERSALLVRDGDKLLCKGNGGPLPADLLEELRDHKAEILSLMKCGQCGTPVTGPLNKYWRVLLDAGAVYLCSVPCVQRAWPWKMEVGHDNRD
jgi:TubC N-terminal docking domain